MSFTLVVCCSLSLCVQSKIFFLDDTAEKKDAVIKKIGEFFAHNNSFFATCELTEDSSIEVTYSRNKSHVLISGFASSNRQTSNEAIAMEDGNEYRVGYEVADGEVLVSCRSHDGNLRSYLPLLTGWLPIDPSIHILDLLGESSKLQTSVAEFDGVRCCQISAIHARGEVSVYVTLEAEFVPIFIKVEQRGSQIPQKDLDDGVEYVEYSYYLKKSNENPDLNRHHTESVSTYVLNGKRKSRKIESDWQIVSRDVKDDDVQLSIEIPNGTRIHMKEKKQLKAIWKNGRIEYPYDTQLVEKLVKASLVSNKNKVGNSPFSFGVLLSIVCAVLLFRFVEWKRICSFLR